MPYIGFHLEESMGNKPIAEFNISGMAPLLFKKLNIKYPLND